MKVKTNELVGAPLDWAVAIAKGLTPSDLFISRIMRDPKDGAIYRRTKDEDGNYNGRYMTGPDLLFSRKWEAGGPLIAQEKIGIGMEWNGTNWLASAHDINAPTYSGPTPLVAAMRCYVASKLGDEVEIPDELLKDCA